MSGMRFLRPALYFLSPNRSIFVRPPSPLMLTFFVLCRITYIPIYYVMFFENVSHAVGQW